MPLNYHDRLYEALRRFGESMRAAAEDVRVIGVALSGIRLDEDYRAAGWPFGATDQAIEIWDEYEQWTTTN